MRNDQTQAKDTTQAKDSRITAAASHWGPSFVTNGIALANFEDVMRSINTRDEWCSAWSARGAEV
jgi:hypothetical protein